MPIKTQQCTFPRFFDYQRKWSTTYIYWWFAKPVQIANCKFSSNPTIFKMIQCTVEWWVDGSIVPLSDSSMFMLIDWENFHETKPAWSCQDSNNIKNHSKHDEIFKAAWYALRPSQSPFFLGCKRCFLH